MSQNALHLLWTLLAALATAIFIAARACVRGASRGGREALVNAQAADSVNELNMTAQSGAARPHVRLTRAHRATRTAGASPAIPTHIVRTVTLRPTSCRRGDGGPFAAVFALI